MLILVEHDAAFLLDEQALREGAPQGIERGLVSQVTCTVRSPGTQKKRRE